MYVRRTTSRPPPADHFEVFSNDLVIFPRLRLVSRDVLTVTLILGMDWHEDLLRLERHV